MTIPKITNIQSSPSDEKIANNWKQVKSLKVKLLQESDWIFVEDSNLTEACIAAWIKWRDRIRRSKQISDIDEAMEYLKALQANKPPLYYANEKPSTLGSYKKLLGTVLKDCLKKIAESLGDEYGSRDVLVEKFEEALRYKQGNNNYILLEIEAELSGKTIQEVADIAINNRQDYLAKLIKMEQSRHFYTKHINSVETFDECDKLLDAILKLAEKNGYRHRH